MTIGKEVPLAYLPAESLLGEFIEPKFASRLIAEYGSLYHAVLHTSEKDLVSNENPENEKGKKLAYLRAIVQRIAMEREKKIKSITSPNDVVEYCLSLQDLEQEEFWVLLLDIKNKILGRKRIFLGTVNFSPVSPIEIFHAAVQRLAPNIILIHNHPSGDPTPSMEDKESTKRLVQAGKILNIEVVDHIIIGKQGHYSFKENDCIHEL